MGREGGLCIMSRAYPSAKADATRTGTLHEQSLGSSYPVGEASPTGETHANYDLQSKL
jgi:hypothetical protein